MRGEVRSSGGTRGHFLEHGEGRSHGVTSGPTRRRGEVKIHGRTWGSPGGRSVVWSCGIASGQPRRRGVKWNPSCGRGGERHRGVHGTDLRRRRQNCGRLRRLSQHGRRWWRRSQNGGRLLRRSHWENGAEFKSGGRLPFRVWAGWLQSRSHLGNCGRELRHRLQDQLQLPRAGAPRRLLPLRPSLLPRGPSPGPQTPGSLPEPPPLHLRPQIIPSEGSCAARQILTWSRQRRHSDTSCRRVPDNSETEVKFKGLR
uniref:Uncharacterized protein LOC116958808 n=1 Tax=Petromyzon marinus TaxID=7757 RepID=A0AAJ7WJG4_PETMA|nr:uncharacterized protein LOC116958808 [Petromyzon marinus]